MACKARASHSRPSMLPAFPWQTSTAPRAASTGNHQAERDRPSEVVRATSSYTSPVRSGVSRGAGPGK
jgi:hypothetical protein